MTNVETVKQLIKERVPATPHLVQMAENLLATARRLDDLQQLNEGLFIPKSDAAKESKELMEKARKAKKKPRTEMQAQTQFPVDGPALFMEGEGKLWKQPVDVADRPSSRVLRLRRGSVSRITSVPLGGR